MTSKRIGNRKQPLRIRNHSFKHWIVKSILVFKLEKMGHEVELEFYIPQVGYCDLIVRTHRHKSDSILINIAFVSAND